MKSRLFVLSVFLITVSFALVSVANAQEAPSLEVLEATICKEVLDRAPLDAGETFSASAGKLYCFTKIGGAESPTEVTHVWYFGTTERAQVTLPVGSVTWRTWSSKIIQPFDIGQWFVDVVDPDGKVLKTLQFKVTP